MSISEDLKKILVKYYLPTTYRFLMKSFIRLSLLIVILFSTALYSQGIIIQKGQNAFSIGAGYNTNEDVSAYGGNFAYTYNGLVTFSVNVRNASVDDTDLSALAIGPSVTFWALKYNSRMPVSLGIGAGYEFDSFSSDAFDQADLSASGSSIPLYAIFGGHFRVSKSVQIVPGASFEYAFTSMKLEDNAGNETEFNDNHGDLSLFAGFAFDVSPNMIVTLSPNVTFGVIGDGNDATTYSLGATLNIK
jgi:hypothetical protein